MVGVIAIAYEDIQKRIKKRKTRFRIFIGIIILSILSVLVFKYPIFKVRNIIVEGNSIVPKEKIVELSSIRDGDNILTINKKGDNKKIEANPYIETSNIRRTVAGNVYIEIKERKSVALVEYEKKFISIDINGVAIEVLDKKDEYNLPIIKGLNIVGINIGQVIELSTPREINTIKIIFDNVNKHDLSDIIYEIDIKNLISIEIKTKYGINFLIGDVENIDSKLDKCKIIMEQDLLKRGLKGTIDVSFKGNPVFRQE